MRWHLVTGVFLYVSSFFYNELFLIAPELSSTHTCPLGSDNTSDFNVRRLSGERVMVSWHTEAESQPVRFEVMRKHDKTKPFVSLGTVDPKTKENNSADYSFIDFNNFSDTTFYCLKKTNADSVIFYSISKSVEGVGKDR